MNLSNITFPSMNQIGFQSNIVFTNSKYFFKYEYLPSKYITIGCDDRNELLTFIQSQSLEDRCYYELLPADTKVREYYDIDLALNPDEMVNVTDLSNEIIDILIAERNDVFERSRISKKDIIVLSAHTSKKLSLHILSKKTCFENNLAQRVHMTELWNHLDSLHLKWNVDKSVYSRNRLFRMLGNTKRGKENHLKIFEPSRYNFASKKDCFIIPNEDDTSRVLSIFDSELVVQQQQHDPRLMNTHMGTVEGILDAWLENYPYLERGRGPANQTRINRIDDTTRTCLVSNDSHSTENMYFFVKDFKVYVNCFCGNGRPLPIGTLPGQLTIEPTPFTHGTHYTEDIDTRLYSNYRTIIDKSMTSYGKTTRAMNFALTNYKRVLVIHHRLSLDADYLSKYPQFTSYLESKNNQNEPLLTVCVNSLHKVDVSSYDLIIIDEIRSVLQQTNMSGMVLSTTRLLGILEDDTKPLILLDANITNEDVSLLKNIRKDSSDWMVIRNRKQNCDKIVHCHEIQSMFGTIEIELNRHLQTCGKVVIAYNCSPEKMDAVLERFEDKRVININRYTRASFDLGSMNLYDEYDLIAYSPTISEGVSFEDRRFESVIGIGLFTNSSSTAETCSQMIARFRAIKTFYIYYSIKELTIPKFEDMDDCVNYYNNNIHIINQNAKNIPHLNFSRRGSLLSITEDLYSGLFFKNRLEETVDKFHFSQTLKRLLVNNGYTLFMGFIEEDTTVSQEYYDTVILPKDKAICESILTSPVMSRDEYLLLKDTGADSYEKKYKVERFEIVDCTHVNPYNLTHSIVEEFKDRKKQNIIGRLSKLFRIKYINDQITRDDPAELIKQMVKDKRCLFEKTLSFSDERQTPLLKRSFLPKLLFLNETLQGLGFEAVSSVDKVPVDLYQRKLKQLSKPYQTDYNLYSELVRMIGKKPYKKQFEEFCFEKVFTNLLEKFLGLRIITDGHFMYQVLTFPFRLYSQEETEPSIFGAVNIAMVGAMDHLVAQHEVMFSRSNTFCSVCNKTLSRGISFRHLNSIAHQKNLAKNLLPLMEEKDGNLEENENKIIVYNRVSTYLCDSCDFTCSTRKRLNEHIIRQHTTKPVCEYCNKHITRQHMAAHIRTKHPILTDSTVIKRLLVS
jgi:hypothetical protein